MIKPRFRKLLLILSAFLVVISSCKKDDFLTDGTDLGFSQNEILFDTVFVSVGSVTKNLKVYNNNDKPVKTNIRLAGSGINFRMNVNGVPGRQFNDVEIRANDSLWIFVEVTVDPGTGSLPFIIEDSIIFETNGNVQDVDLVAWGQNAHFIVADHFPSGLPSYALLDPNLNATITWDSILPYVVYGYAVVDSSQTLNIMQGTKIHFYNNSGLWVYKGGSLNVQGTLDHPVIFQGTRRESYFQEEPGQWDRIWLNNGSTSNINYAIIKNGFIGIQCDLFPTPAAPDLLNLSNTKIRNMSGAGILSSNFTIEAWNNVISNCGSYACALTAGGNYNFYHCTIGNYWNYNQRSTPSVYINNFQAESSTTIAVYDLDRADFSNCIIDGKEDDELGIDSVSNPGKIKYQFTNCIIKAAETPTIDSHFVSICRNCNAAFADNQQDYELQSGSSAIGAGNPVYVISGKTLTDINGKIRPQNGNPKNPDLGAFEKQ